MKLNTTPFSYCVLGCTLLGAMLSLCASATACPFCSATQQTLGEEIQNADVAVLAKLIKAPPPYDPNKDNGESFGSGLDPENSNGTFEVVEVLRGEPHALPGQKIETLYYGRDDKELLFMLTGIRTDRIDWTNPLQLSDTAARYLRRLNDLPKKGDERLAFFQDYLENDDPILAQDAYEEFARADYDTVIALKDQMDHDKLVNWIHDVQVPLTRRRLYFTMLGVCGSKDDLPMLEFYMTPSDALFKSAADAMMFAANTPVAPIFGAAFYEQAERYDRLKRQGLDAIIGCYLTLAGPNGLDLVDELFFKDSTTDFAEVHRAMTALRFHGEETDIIPRQRLLQSMRLVLNNPNFADQVIADLSRWEDWEVMDRLVEMFKNPGEENWVRQPIATYMLIAAEQDGEVGKQGTAYLAELREIDSETVDDAERYVGFGLAARAMPRPADTTPNGAVDTAVDGGTQTTTVAADDVARPTVVAPSPAPETPLASDAAAIAANDVQAIQPKRSVSGDDASKNSAESASVNAEVPDTTASQAAAASATSTAQESSPAEISNSIVVIGSAIAAVVLLVAIVAVVMFSSSGRAGT